MAVAQPTQPKSASRRLHFSANLHWLYTEQPVELRPAAAAADGFRAIEHSQPYQLPPTRWRDLLRDADVQQVLINTPSGPKGSPIEFGSACIPGAVRQFRTGFAEALRYALVIDCPMINVMAGVQPPDVPRAQATDAYLHNLAWAVAECAGTDTTLLIEAINSGDRPGAFIHRQEQAADLLSQLGSDRVRLLFDMYHCQAAQGDVARTFLRHLPLIQHVQLADVPTRAEPGTGELNFDYLLDVVRQCGYTGWVGLEYTPANTTDAGLRWLPDDHLPLA